MENIPKWLEQYPGAFGFILLGLVVGFIWGAVDPGHDVTLAAMAQKGGLCALAGVVAYVLFFTG